MKQREVLLSVPEFSDALSVTHACTRHWLHERRISSVKVGRLRKIPESEIDRIVSEGFCPAKPRPEVRQRSRVGGVLGLSGANTAMCAEGA